MDFYILSLNQIFAEPLKDLCQKICIPFFLSREIKMSKKKFLKIVLVVRHFTQLQLIICAKNIFPQFMAYLFTFLVVSFGKPKFIFNKFIQQIATCSLWWQGSIQEKVSKFINIFLFNLSFLHFLKKSQGLFF